MSDELRALCERIRGHHYDDEQWRQRESDDMFQSERFSGGYDAGESAFCFSYYDDRGSEYWFQLTLLEALDIADGRTKAIEVRPAE